MSAHGMTILSALALLGCQRNEGSTAQAPPPARTAAAAPVVQQPKPGDRVDIHGIVVTYREAGVIEISGRDRWGNMLHSSYESIEFFREALPVIERSLATDQAAGLHARFGTP